MNFNFFMPTKILMGKNIVLKNYELFEKLGKKALIVTGKSSAKNGSLKDVEEALNLANVEYKIFNEVEENPSLETVEKASTIGKEFGVEFVIGIGGGSPLDASKAIAIMIKNKDLTKETLFTSNKLEWVDIVAVPTTSGTGSETTHFSILTDHGNKTKKNLGQNTFPKISFLDASYTESMPLSVTRNTALDALSHIVEGYLNTNANLFTDGLAQIALNLWGQCIESLIKGKVSFEEREKLMFASTLGGIIIAQTGTSLPHGMGYSLTYFKGMPHGLANVCLYKEFLGVFKDRSRVNNIHKMLGLVNYDDFIGVIDNLAKTDANLSEKEAEEFAKAMSENTVKLKNHPEKIIYEELYNIYYNSFNK